MTDTSPVSTEDCAGLTLLRDLSPDLLRRVLARARVAEVAAGEVILRRGAANQTLHFLLAGRLRVIFDLEAPGQGIDIPPGRMFGEMSVIDGEPASAFVVAAAPSRVLMVPAEVFWGEVVTAPGVPQTVMRSLSGLLRANNAALVAAMQERLRLEVLAKELSVARDIQMGMLQPAGPCFPEERRIGLAMAMRPAKEVGGDLYEAVRLDEDRLLVAVGDVSGKGVSAALFMVRALTLLRMGAAHAPPTERLLAELNDALAAGNDAAMFVTVLLGVLDMRSGELELVNCGHTPAVLRGADGGVATHAVKPSPALGMFEGARFSIARLLLAPGTTLLVTSDGVNEAMDPAKAEFGTDRLLDAVAAGPAAEAPLLGHIIAAVDRHAAGAEQADDITLLALTWRGPG